QSRCDRLLDEHIDPVLQKLDPDPGVVDSRHSDADRIHFAEELTVVGVWRRVELGSDLLCPRFENVDNTREMTQFRVETGMLLSEVSDAYNCNLSHNSTKESATKGTKSTKIMCLMCLFVAIPLPQS